jgi:hypothetical protein
MQMNFKHGFSVGLQRLAAMVMAAVLMVACGGGGSDGGAGVSALGQSTSRKAAGTLISPPAATGNVVPIVVDAGPVSGSSEINVAYVSVTVCTPGTTTANCQTIDHVMLDTGSSGLRLLNSALYSNLNLPVVTNSSGQTLGECMSFAIGTTWGSVLSADIYLGGEVAASVPIQIIGDQPGGVGGIPNDCSSTGTIQNTQATLGANGILGVGLFVNDCDICSSPVVPPMYYTCTATCTSSGVDSAQLVKNPVALFPQDNNGVLIQLPAVLSVGSTGLTGSLIFGIGTQSNNPLGSAIVVYPTDASGNFTTTYNSIVMAQSYIDSGSNALFFNDSIAQCSATTWAYCPPSPLPLSANNTAAIGGHSGVVNFSIVAVDSLSSNIVAANIGGPYGGSSPQFAWGLPFFYGRSVFTAILGKSTPGGPGPYFAY